MSRPTVMSWRSFLCALLGFAILLQLRAAESQQIEHWEGTLKQGARETFFRMEIDSSERGFLEILGQKLPVEIASRDGGKIEIRTVESKPTIFRGERRADRIAGEMLDERGNASFWMELDPALPRPQGRSEAWAQDLSYASRKLLQLDRSITPATREAFRGAMAQLEANARTFDDPHIMVGLAEAVALADNAHTRLYLVRNRTEIRQYPIRVWWFRNELRVVRAAPEHADLLGCELTKIGAHSVADLRSRVARLYAGSRSWADYMSTYTLTSPEILFGLNAIPAMGKALWTFHCPGGVRWVELEPLPLRKTDKAVEAWWDLAPDSPNSNGDFASVALTSVPLYLRHPDRNYWFDRQDNLGLLYFQFNRAADQGDESLREFGVRLEVALREAKVRAFVVDLRFNTGGNLDIGRDLMERLQAAAVGRKVYVITGRATFSAGIFHAAQWKQWGKATFIGEPVGDGLDFWSEGGNITLPNSGLVIHFANAFHSYSRKEYPDRKPYFEDLSIDSLTPDHAASPAFEDYISGRDPALELVVSQFSRAPKAISAPNLAKPHQFR